MQSQTTQSYRGEPRLTTTARTPVDLDTHTVAAVDMILHEEIICFDLSSTTKQCGARGRTTIDTSQGRTTRATEDQREMLVVYQVRQLKKAMPGSPDSQPKGTASDLKDKATSSLTNTITPLTHETPV
jgi:hypothetical protein